jgi:hypothetical protein
LPQDHVPWRILILSVLDLRVVTKKSVGFWLMMPEEQASEIAMHRYRRAGVVLGGLVVIVLAIGPKVHGFKPGRERWLFKGDKNPSGVK